MAHHGGGNPAPHHHVAGVADQTAHGFIVLHATDNARAGTGNVCVTARHDAGVTTTATPWGVILAHVANTTGLGMDPFHARLATLAAAYLACGFDFEKHF